MEKLKKLRCDNSVSRDYRHSMENAQSWSTGSSSATSSREFDINNVSYHDLKALVNERKKEREIRKSRAQVETALVLKNAKQRSFDTLLTRSNEPTQRQRSFHQKMGANAESRSYERFEAQVPVSKVQPVVPSSNDTASTVPLSVSSSKSPSIVSKRPPEDATKISSPTEKNACTPAVDSSSGFEDKFSQLEELCAPVFQGHGMPCNDIFPMPKKHEKKEKMYNHARSFYDLNDDDLGTEVVLQASSFRQRHKFARLKLRKDKKSKKKKKEYSLKTLVMPMDCEYERYASGKQHDDDDDQVSISRRNSPPHEPIVNDDLDRYCLEADGEEDEAPLEPSGLVRTNSKFRGDDVFTNGASLADWPDGADRSQAKVVTPERKKCTNREVQHFDDDDMSWSATDAERNKRDTVVSDWDLTLHERDEKNRSLVVDPDDIIAMSRNDKISTPDASRYMCVSFKK